MIQLSRVNIKKSTVFLRRFYKLKYIFVVNFLLLCLLLARNPFNQRTLIPNIEPYPDTIFYIAPARSLAQGDPFKLIREGRETNPGVPPLYSLSLVPFYLINHDARMFYFANVLMSLTSLYLFFRILKKITDDKWIVLFLLFLFVTNFFIYWYPQWAMSENLLLPLFLGGTLLLISKLSYKNILLAAFISVSFYATKYACAPMMLIYSFGYLIKIVFEAKSKHSLVLRKVFFYLLFLGIFSSGIFIYGYFVNGLNPLGIVISLFQSLVPLGGVGTSTVSNTSNSWMSMQYIKVNLPQYLDSLIGGRHRFLWDFTPIVAPWVGVLGILGLIAGFFVSKNRLLSLGLIGLLSFEILFMSMFYALDIRYIYFAIPTLLLGFAMFLSIVKAVCVKRKLYYIFLILIFLMSGLYLTKNVIRIKSQIVINAKYAETPWYYISVLKLNAYFDEKKEIKPVVISPMPPYYIDFYSNGNYELLPLSTGQEFRSRMDLAWGEHDYSDLHKLYTNYLKNGRELYVSTYGLGNEAYLHTAYEALSEKFKTTEVYVDCYKLCNLYKVELK